MLIRLDPVICIAHGAWVMLTPNLWYGNSNNHLQKRPSTTQPPSFCYGTVQFLPGPHTSWRNSSYCPHPPHLVCIKCPVFMFTTAPKARMGCYYPQSTGLYPRQSGNWRWEERVRLWADIWWLLLRLIVDWSAIQPSISFQTNMHN